MVAQSSMIAFMSNSIRASYIADFFKQRDNFFVKDTVVATCHSTVL